MFAAGPRGKSPSQLIGLIRGHWRRNACWHEDAAHTRDVDALANLALLRSVLWVELLSLRRGWLV